MVHHDLWDYDPTAAPQLITVRKDGKKIDAVAQATKQGFVFVFDRVTGKPVWPIEERAGAGERRARREGLADAAVLDVAAERAAGGEAGRPHAVSHQRRRARGVARTHRQGAHGAVQSAGASTETAVVPGAVGGTNWGNTAANPAAGVVYLLNQDFPSFYKLQEQADRNVAGGRGRFGPPDPARIEARQDRVQGKLRAVPRRGSRRHARRAVVADRRQPDRISAATPHRDLWQRTHAAARAHRGRSDRRHTGVSRRWRWRIAGRTTRH